MKKLFQRLMVATMCMSLMVINPISAFAMETVDNDYASFFKTEEVPSVYSTDSVTLKLSIAVGQGYVQSPWTYIGASPTIKVTGKGNSGMQYRVRLQGTGSTNYVVGYLYANGSTLTNTLKNLRSGNYWIFIEPWNGSTNGQTVNFDVTIS